MRAICNGALLAGNIVHAKSLFQRMRGLLGRAGLPAGTAMLIDPCSSIHTLGMRFPIDAVFLDRQSRVTRVCTGIIPCRAVLGGRSAVKVLEFESGSADLSLVGPGSTIVFEE